MEASAVSNTVENISASKPDVEVRTCRRLEVGKVIMQGDVYLFRVKGTHPHGRSIGTRQVAVGEQVGARHVVEGDNVFVYEGKQLPDGVTEPEWLEPGELLGPVVVATQSFKLTHPEHAHHKLPAGTYQVTYQADATTRRRVVD